MKERLEIVEKSILLFIPYLIVLSLAYYWGYWGYLDIDAISYYGVQDLIKGFTYALPGVLLLGIAFIAVNTAMGELVSKLRKRFNKWIAFALLIVPSGFIFWFILDTFSTGTILHWEFIFLSMMVLSTILEALFSVIGQDWQWATDNAILFFASKWVVIFCLVSFISSYAYGRNKAMSIINNEYFSYMQLVVASDTTKTKRIFKYLGKAGESHFFISPDNKEKRIISASIIPTLVLHECEASDSASVRAYNAALLIK